MYLVLTNPAPDPSAWLIPDFTQPPSYNDLVSLPALNSLRAGTTVPSLCDTIKPFSTWGFCRTGLLLQANRTGTSWCPRILPRSSCNIMTSSSLESRVPSPPLASTTLPTPSRTPGSFKTVVSLTDVRSRCRSTQCRFSLDISHSVVFEKFTTRRIGPCLFSDYGNVNVKVMTVDLWVNDNKYVSDRPAVHFVSISFSTTDCWSELILIVGCSSSHIPYLSAN